MMELAKIPTDAKPRMRMFDMVMYVEGIAAFEWTRYELRGGPKSPPTIDLRFISDKSAEKAYQMWLDQVAEVQQLIVKWEGDADAQRDAG